MTSAGDAGAHIDWRKVDHAKVQRAPGSQWPDRDVLDLWRAHGGEWHGPNVETVTMPMYLLTGFLAAYAARSATPGGDAAGLDAEVERLRAQVQTQRARADEHYEHLLRVIDAKAGLYVRATAAERERDSLRAENDRLRARLGDANPLPGETEGGGDGT